MKEKYYDPRCPVCGVIPDLGKLTEESMLGREDLTACCRHLVPTLEFGCVADELALFCGGQPLWQQIRAGLSFSLKEQWREAIGDEGQSHDLEGEYFIKCFVEPCASVAQVDLHYDTVGSVGCSSNACIPFVWVTDRSVFAQQLLEQLTHPTPPKARHRQNKRVAGAPASRRPRNKAAIPTVSESPGTTTPQGTAIPGKKRLNLKAINARHVRNSDKWYRMFAGAASMLTSFKQGIIHLDIHVDNRLDEPLEQITGKIAKSWLLEEELQHAQGYLAHLYKTERPSGCAVVSDGSGAGALAEELVRRMKEMAVEYPDVLITTIAGSYAKP